MRELKFRVWNGQIMCYDEPERFLRWADGTLEPDPECSYVDLMQFTGLQDKNGQDIYEGDIVRVEDCSNGVVAWSSLDGAWRLELLGDAWYILGDTWARRLREIIGNIYENEELIP